MTLVSLKAVERYDDAFIDEAIAAHFDALHVADDLKPGMRVLLKPNLLAARDPAMAVTTHPAILAGAARWLRSHGITDIVLADSFGGLHTVSALRTLYKVCGLQPLAPLLTLSEDTGYGSKNGFNLLNPVLEADYIINCAKLKTHGLTTMTAGVKNLFGCIPGLQKPEWHCRKPSVSSFSSALIDLCETVRPNVTLIDAIDCMEGNGPGGGDVRHMGMTIASRSPYAADEIGAKLMGLPHSLCPIIHAARKRGVISGDITLTGDPLVPADPPFKLPDAIVGKEKLLTPNGLFHHFFGRRKRPKVILNNCIGCGKCAESCPMHIIEIQDRKAVIGKKGCISCFCCQEMCPAHAIDVK